jgi:hypothetical protein
MVRDVMGAHLVFLTDRCPPVTLVPMPRAARYAPGGLVYHVLNRGVVSALHVEGAHHNSGRCPQRPERRAVPGCTAFCTRFSQWYSPS